MSQAKPGDPLKDAEFETNVEKMRFWCANNNSRNLTAKHFQEMWKLGHELKLCAQAMLEVRRKQSSVERARPEPERSPDWEQPSEEPPVVGA